MTIFTSSKKVSFDQLNSFKKEIRKEALHQIYGGHGGGNRKSQKAWKRHKMLHKRRKAQR